VAFETGCRPQEIRRVEVRHFDATHSRWVFPVSESKGKRQPRIVYLTPRAEAITKELVARFPQGRLFRDGNGRELPQGNIDSAFRRLRRRMARQAMEESGVTPAAAAKNELKRCGDVRSRKELTAAERRKIDMRVYEQFAPRYCLYVLRHSFATVALQSGLDGLTVGVLLGHNDPSMLGRVYQHLSHNPEHLLNQVKKTTEV
jgi:integrase